MKLQVLYYKIIAASLMMAAMGWFSDVVWAQKNYNAIRINANGYLDFNGDSPVVRRIDYNFKNFIFDDEGCFAFGVHGLDIVDLDGNVILKGDNKLYCIYNLLIARSVEEIEQYYIGYVTNFKDGHFAFRIVCVEGDNSSGYKAEIIKDEEGIFARGLFPQNLSSEEKELARKELLSQIQFFQHERLIHLIVTVLFAILTMLSFYFTLVLNMPILFALTGLFLALLIPYIAHYYLLENGTQKLYEYYDAL